MNGLENLPGSTASKDARPVRSSVDHPDVRKTQEAYDLEGADVDRVTVGVARPVKK